MILTCLKHKHKEWTTCQADLIKFWTEIYSKNYHKPLDEANLFIGILEIMKNSTQKNILFPLYIVIDSENCR